MQKPTASSSRQPASLILLILGLAAALCYGVALARFPLLAIYAQPIQNLEKLTNADPRTGLALAGVIVLLFVGYGLGAVALWRNRDDRLHSRVLPLVLLGFPLLFLALLVLVYPTTSVDLYDYMFRGRMLVRYHANTFVQTPTDFKSDPLFWYVAWRRAVTAYGPLWEGMSWLTARLAGETITLPSGTDPAIVLPAQHAQLLRLMLAYKGLAALGFVSCGVAIWAVLHRTAPQWRWFGVYLWLWNPLALWESFAAGHNDAWMALLIVLAVGFATPAGVRGQGSGFRVQGTGDEYKEIFAPLLPVSVSFFVLSLLVLTLGGLVKFLALLFGPLLLVAALRSLPSWRAQLRLMLVGGLACAALVLLAYAPFWVGPDTLRNFGDRGTLFTSSWLAVIQAPLTLPLVKALIPARDLLAWLVPGDQSEAVSQRVAVVLGLGLLMFGVLWSCWRAWERPAQVASHALWLLLWFLFLCNPWFQPWYVLWALALLALQPWHTRLLWALGLFCCTAMLSYLAGVFLLPLLGWNGDSAEWNALQALAIYGPPLLALLWGFAKPRQDAVARSQRSEALVYRRPMIDNEQR